MALKHHTDSDLRISQQVENSENYVLAFINETYKVVSGLNVLEMVDSGDSKHIVLVLNSNMTITKIMAVKERVLKV